MVVISDSDFVSCTLSIVVQPNKMGEMAMTFHGPLQNTGKYILLYFFLLLRCILSFFHHGLDRICILFESIQMTIGRPMPCKPALDDRGEDAGLADMIRQDARPIDDGIPLSEEGCQWAIRDSGDVALRYQETARNRLYNRHIIIICNFFYP